MEGRGRSERDRVLKNYIIGNILCLRDVPQRMPLVSNAVLDQNALENLAGVVLELVLSLVVACWWVLVEGLRGNHRQRSWSV